MLRPRTAVQTPSRVTRRAQEAGSSRGGTRHPRYPQTPRHVPQSTLARPRGARAAESSSGYSRSITRVEATHRFDVPVERAFSFVTDTANWSSFWPGFVRLEEGARWRKIGDTAQLVTRLLGRQRLLTMRITAFEANRLVKYTSTQPGLPDASHERHFDPDGAGFVYRLVVQYEPRRGLAGFFDRYLLARGIRRAFERTFTALEHELSPCGKAAPRRHAR